MRSDHERLEFAKKYYAVFPCNFRNPNAPKDEPYLYISKDCPEDIKERLLVEWEKIKAETTKRHEEGIFSSNDYF